MCAGLGGRSLLMQIVSVRIVVEVDRWWGYPPNSTLFLLWNLKVLVDCNIRSPKKFQEEIFCWMQRKDEYYLLKETNFYSHFGDQNDACLCLPDNNSRHRLSHFFRTRTKIFRAFCFRLFSFVQPVHHFIITSITHIQKSDIKITCDQVHFFDFVDSHGDEDSAFVTPVVARHDFLISYIAPETLLKSASFEFRERWYQAASFNWNCRLEEGWCQWAHNEGSL